MTELLYRDEPYRRSAEAVVLDASGGEVVLDQTVFYPQGGGQPGDTGWLVKGSLRLPVVGSAYGADGVTVRHGIAPGHGDALRCGDTVTAELDWPLRYARMRVHTALHLLTTVLAFPVTGGAVGDGDGRLDFDMPEAGDRAGIETALNDVIGRDLPVSTRWITDEELAANPSLVKTMSVKPPMGSGRVRLVAIGDVDLQPCGGTHVASTGEIGRVAVTAIEKKGRQNRRVRIALVPSN